MAERHEYIPASRAVMKSKDKKYDVVLDGHRIEVSRPDFIEQNQILSAMYGAEENKARRGEIAHRLYTLDLPVFKSWDIFNSDDRVDYEQEAYLWMVVALDSYDKKKGSFLYWLRQIVKRARDEYYNDKNRGAWYCKTCDRYLASKDATRYHVDKGHEVELKSSVEPIEEPGEEGPDIDADLAVSKLRDSLSPEKWEMIRMKIINGMKVEEIAASLGVHRETARLKINSAVDAIKAGMVPNSSGQVFLDDGSEWLSIKQFAVRMTFSQAYVTRLLNPNSPRKWCKWIIDSNDFILQGRKRIRYKLDKNGKLIFPRMYERKDKRVLNPIDVGDENA